MSHKEYCISVFKPLIDQYKKNKEPLTNEQKLSETYTKDYMLFQKLHKAFTAFEQLLKYVVIKNSNYYSAILKEFELSDEDTQELDKMTINIPKNQDDLLELFKTYPEAIESIHDELYEIINLEDYEALLVFKKINILLYYSVVADSDTSDKILFFEDSINEFSDIVHKLIKKLMRGHIEMIVNSRKSKNS